MMIVKRTSKVMYLRNLVKGILYTQYVTLIVSVHSLYGCIDLILYYTEQYYRCESTRNHSSMN